MKRLSAFLVMMALAACNDDAATPDAAKGRPAAVQQGTISDAMIPLEQLESQAPLMPERPSAEAIDDAQPDVEPVKGIEQPTAREDAGEAPAAPASDTPSAE